MKQIKELYAFLTDDPITQEEGICSFTKDGKNWPMITGSKRNIEILRTIADGIVEMNQVKIKLVKFTTRKEIEVFE